MLTPNTLRKLPRNELQKLAKENDIKANLKSDTIIELYCQKHANASKRGPSSISAATAPTRKPKAAAAAGAKIPKGGRRSPVKPPETQPTKNTRARRSATKAAPPEPPKPSKRRRRSQDAADKEPLNPEHRTSVRSQTPTEAADLRVSVPRPFTPPHGRPGSVDSSVIGTPESSPERDSITPEPASEEAIDYMLGLIEEAAASDTQLIDQIEAIKHKAATAKKRASDIRAVLRAETGRRERIDSFIRYWRPTKGGWPYEALWGGKLLMHRTVDGTMRYEAPSSDEEGWVPQHNIEYLRNKPRRPGTPPPQASGEELQEYDRKLAEYNREISDWTPGCLVTDPVYKKRKAEEKSAAPNRNDTGADPKGKKRAREADVDAYDSEEEDRRQRQRMDDVEELEYISDRDANQAVPTPTVPAEEPVRVQGAFKKVLRSAREPRKGPPIS